MDIARRGHGSRVCFAPMERSSRSTCRRASPCGTFALRRTPTQHARMAGRDLTRDEWIAYLGDSVRTDRPAASGAPTRWATRPTRAVDEAADPRHAAARRRTRSRPSPRSTADMSAPPRIGSPWITSGVPRPSPDHASTMRSAAARLRLGDLTIVLVGRVSVTTPSRNCASMPSLVRAVAAVDLADHDCGGFVPPLALGPAASTVAAASDATGATLIETGTGLTTARVPRPGSRCRLSGAGSDRPASGSTTAGGRAAGGSGSGRAD